MPPMLAGTKRESVPAARHCWTRDRASVGSEESAVSLTCGVQSGKMGLLNVILVSLGEPGIPG